MCQVLGTWISVANLLAHGLDDRRGTMAQQIAAPAGKEIEIAVPFGIPDVRAFAARQHDGKAAVIGNHVLLNSSSISRIHRLARHELLVVQFAGVRNPPWSKALSRPLHPSHADLHLVLDDFRPHAFARIHFQQQRVPQRGRR